MTGHRWVGPTAPVHNRPLLSRRSKKTVLGVSLEGQTKEPFVNPGKKILFDFILPDNSEYCIGRGADSEGL